MPKNRTANETVKDVMYIEENEYGKERNNYAKLLRVDNYLTYIILRIIEAVCRKMSLTQSAIGKVQT